MLYLVLKSVHLICMATWFASGLFLPGDVRRTLSSPAGDLDLLRDRVRRMSMIAMVFGTLTLLTGLALIFERGGFGAVPVPIHIGLLLTLFQIGAGVGMGHVWNGLDTQLKQGTPRTKVVAGAGRLSMLAGIFQLLWLVTLLLMVFRHNLM